EALVEGGFVVDVAVLVERAGDVGRFLAERQLRGRLLRLVARGARDDESEQRYDDESIHNDVPHGSTSLAHGDDVVGVARLAAGGPDPLGYRTVVIPAVRRDVRQNVEDWRLELLTRLVAVAQAFREVGLTQVGDVRRITRGVLADEVAALFQRQGGPDG